MSKGYSGLFHYTMGTSFVNDTIGLDSFDDRNIDIPQYIKDELEVLKEKGDYTTGGKNDFSMKDVSVLSKETGVEFAKVTIGEKTYLIRGDRKGTTIPNELLSEMKKKGGRIDFHSHPHNNDSVPSYEDRNVMRLMKRITGQKISYIVTPNGKVTMFNEHGVMSVKTVSNTIDEKHKKALLKLFGGKTK